MSNARTTLAALMLLLSVAGCPRDAFHIEMQRVDGGVQRTVTAWHVDDEEISSVAKEVSDRLAQQYGEVTRLDDKRVRCQKIFKHRIDGDISHKSLTNYVEFGGMASPMGTTFAYVERLPGEPRMIEIARRADRLSDTAARAFVAYFKRHAELVGGADRLARLERFLRGELRDDVLEMGLLLWLQHKSLDADDEQASRGAMVRTLVFMSERGYIEVGDVGTLNDMPSTLLRGVKRKAATAMGYDPNEPLPALLAGLSPENMEIAFDEGLLAIGVKKEEYEEEFSRLVGFDFGDGLSGTIVWTGATEPLETNGSWDPEKKQVSWEGRSVFGGALPEVFYARWASPDEGFQRTHFGGVVLRADLPEYNAWYGALDPKNRRALDAFLESLLPGPSLEKKLKVFRFEVGKGTAEGTEQPTSNNPPLGINLILAEISPKE